MAEAAYLTFSNADGSPPSIPAAAANAEQTTPRRDQQHRLAYHCSRLLFGFLAICVVGYVLPQAAVNITDQFGLPDVLFGVVIVAVATTLLEKFVAVMSRHRGHPGISLPTVPAATSSSSPYEWASSWWTLRRLWVMGT